MDCFIHVCLRFFPFYSQEMFCEKLCSMIIWFWHQIISSSFCCDKFNISMFSRIYMVFPKTSLFINLKKPVSKSFFDFFLRSLFMSIYDFNRAFCLNLITPCKFFKNNPWCNACFKFLMCITYSVLSCKLATSFSNFSIFFLSGKKGKSFWRSCNFPGYWTSNSRKYHQDQQRRCENRCNEYRCNAIIGALRHYVHCKVTKMNYWFGKQ